MKILFLTDHIKGYKTTASFRIGYLSSKKLSEKGHNVTFVSPANNSHKIVVNDESDFLVNIETPGLFPKRIRTGGFSLFDIIVKIHVVVKGKYDVIHVICGHRPGQLIPAIVGKYISKSIIIDEWWDWYGKGGWAEMRKGPIGRLISIYDRLLELPCKRLYDGVISITNALKNRLKKNNHVIVLHGGAENCGLTDYDMNSTRDHLGLSRDLFIVGMSNLDIDDFDDNNMVFKAFEKLSNEYDSLRLMVTGNRDYLDSFCENVSFKDKIIALGWIPFGQYNRYLSACNLFILPFRNIHKNAGRWPNKIGDYLCLNRPIISNPTGDLLEMFYTFKIGFLCKESFTDFYNLLKNILEKEIDLSEFHIDSKYVSEKILSFNKRIDAIEKFYQKIRNEKC